MRGELNPNEVHVEDGHRDHDPIPQRHPLLNQNQNVIDLTFNPSKP